MDFALGKEDTMIEMKKKKMIECLIEAYLKSHIAYYTKTVYSK